MRRTRRRERGRNGQRKRGRTDSERLLRVRRRFGSLPPGVRRRQRTDPISDFRKRTRSLDDFLGALGSVKAFLGRKTSDFELGGSGNVNLFHEGEVDDDGFVVVFEGYRGLSRRESFFEGFGYGRFVRDPFFLRFVHPQW